MRDYFHVEDFPCYSCVHCEDIRLALDGLVEVGCSMPNARETFFVDKNTKVLLFYQDGTCGGEYPNVLECPDYEEPKPEVVVVKTRVDMSKYERVR